MKTITVTMTTEQFAAISKLVNYIVDTQTEDFEEFICEGGNPNDHIMSDADKVYNMLERR